MVAARITTSRLASEGTPTSKESTWDQPVMRSNKRAIQQMILRLTESASVLDAQGLYEGVLAGRPPVKKIAVVLAWCHSAEWMTEPTAEQCAHTERKVRESAEERDRKQQD